MSMLCLGDKQPAVALTMPSNVNIADEILFQGRLKALMPNAMWIKFITVGIV